MIDILSPTCSQLLFLATHWVIQSNAEWSMWPFQDAAAVMPMIDGCGEFKEKMKNGWQSNGMKWRHITDTPQFISFSNQILLRGTIVYRTQQIAPGLRKRSFLLNFHWIITCLKVLVSSKFFADSLWIATRCQINSLDTFSHFWFFRFSLS